MEKDLYNKLGKMKSKGSLPLGTKRFLSILFSSKGIGSKPFEIFLK